ncbi:MAG TPA: potassium channel family protein [Pilimelia sp.]|nr:potassium channel family protein [Pilimelia sp.]
MRMLFWPVRALYRGVVWVANSPRALLGSYFVLLVVGGGLYSLFEGKGLGDSVWWAVVTASTVGYGDTYPTTGAGRVVAGTLISIMVLLVIPLITAHFASKLIVDHDAFQHEEQEEIKQNLRRLRELTEALAAHVGVSPGPDSADPAPEPSGRRDKSRPPW